MGFQLYITLKNKRPHGRPPFFTYCIFIVLYHSIIPESPRWLITQGREEEAMEIISKIATVNGKKLPETLEFDEEEKVSRYLFPPISHPHTRIFRLMT